MEYCTVRISSGMMDVTRSVDVKMPCQVPTGVNKGKFTMYR